MIPVQLKHNQAVNAKPRVLRSVLLSAGFALLVLIGCQDRDPADGEDTADTTTQYDLSFAEPTFAEPERVLDTLFAVDLDDDGRREYVVTSIVHERISAPDTRADHIKCLPL